MMPEKKHYSYTNLADTPQVSSDEELVGVRVLSRVAYVHQVQNLAASPRAALNIYNRY